MAISNIGATHDPLLTNVATEYAQSLDGLVLDKYAKLVPVEVLSGKYFKGDKTWLGRKNPRPVSSFGQPVEVSYSMNFGNFALEGYALATYLSEMEKTIGTYSLPFDLRQKVIALLTKDLRVWFEEQGFAFLKTELTNAGMNATPTTKWNASGSDPVADVDTAKKAMIRRPNVMVMNKDTFLALRSNAVIRDMIKYTTPSSVTVDVLKTVFDVENIYIGDWKYENNGSFVSLHADDVYLGYIEPTGTIPEMSHAFILWNGTQLFSVWTAFDPKYGIKQGSEWIKVEMIEDVLSSIPEAGYVLTDVLA